jgi:hypothetical protein
MDATAIEVECWVPGFRVTSTDTESTEYEIQQCADDGVTLYRRADSIEVNYWRGFENRGRDGAVILAARLALALGGRTASWCSPDQAHTSAVIPRRR